MVNNLKDLKSLLKLCRQHGVTEINLGMVALKLGELPTEHPVQQIEEQDEESFFESFPDGPLTPEELTFFANGGRPEENPYRKINEN